MEMTNKEETLDWLYRLRSEIYVYMPKEWLIPMNNALDVAIDTIKREKMLEDWTKKCRKFEADYENRLKADLKAILVELQLEIEEIKPLKPTDDEDWQYGCFHGLKLMQDKCLKLIQQKINSLKEA